MRTIDDLRAALELRAQLADPRPAEADAATTLITLAPHHRPRRRIAAALSAVAVALIVVAVAVRALSASDAPAPAGSPSAPGPLRAGEWGFSLTALPDLTVRTYSWFDGELQQLELSDAGHALELTVYAPGAAYTDHQFPSFRSAADGSGLPGATRVTVGTDIAYYGAFGNSSNATPGTVESAAANLLAWQYAPDAWALLRQQGSIPESELLRVANAIDFSQSTPVPTPVAFDAPPGARLVNWELDARHRADRNPAAPWTVLAGYASASEDSDVVIEVHNQSFEGGGNTSSPVHITVGGRPADFYPSDPRLDFAVLDFSTANGVCAEIRWPADGGDPTQEQLVALAETMQAADPADPATWFDGRTALP